MRNQSVAHFLFIEIDIPVDVIPTKRSDEGSIVEINVHVCIFRMLYLT